MGDLNLGSNSYENSIVNSLISPYNTPSDKFISVIIQLKHAFISQFIVKDFLCSQKKAILSKYPFTRGDLLKAILEIKR